MAMLSPTENRVPLLMQLSSQDASHSMPSSVTTSGSYSRVNSGCPDAPAVVLRCATSALHIRDHGSGRVSHIRASGVAVRRIGSEHVARSIDFARAAAEVRARLRLRGRLVSTYGSGS